MRRKVVFGTASLALLLLLVASLVFLSGSHKASALRLPDGTLVELDAITYGTNHVVWRGTLFQRLLRFLPKDKVPKKFSRKLIQRKLDTTTNSVVLWLHMAGPAYEFRGSITDTNGFGAVYRSESLNKTPGGTLHPVVLEEWPREAPEIAITFFEEMERKEKTVGRLSFKNPLRQSVRPFTAQMLPSKQKNGDLGLTLVSLEALPGGKAFDTMAGRYWACRARFQMEEGGIRNQDWKVQSMWLMDSGGNRRQATGPRAWKGEFFEIFSTPLWLDNPVWRLEANLTRSANFRPEETVTFSGVTMPSSEIEDAIFKTNLFGLGLTLHSMKRAKPGHDMGGPGFAVEVDAAGDDWIPKIVGIWDEQGKALRVPPHGYGPGYSVMRFSAGTENPKSLKVAVTLQQYRKYTFFAPPTVITNVSN